MRPKTKRRLLILFAVLILVIGGAALLIVSNNAKRDRMAKEARAQGMAAFEAGRYETALSQLSQYNGRVRDDADAIYAQAVSRSMVIEPNKRHLKSAIDWLNRYKDLRPSDPRATQKLLELYTRAGWSMETLATAEEVLKKDPNDLEALRAKVATLSGQRKFKEALPASEQINQLAPLDLDGQRMTYFLLGQLKRPSDELINRAKADLDKHPEDPRFELLLASAYGYAGDNANAQKWLLAATARKAPDAEFVQRATRLLDSAQAFDLSRNMLERAVTELNDPAVLQLLVQRLWQSGEVAEMGKRLERFDAKNADANVNLLAMKAISHFEQGQTEGATAIVEALAKRQADDEAYAWSAAIGAHYARPRDAKSAITVLQSAANRNRDNAVVQLWMGDSYEQLGEIELAVGAWRAAAQLAPAWATPHVRQAKALALSGRPVEAMKAASEASQRAPKAIDTRIAGALARSAMLADDTRSVSGAELFRGVEQIQKNHPNEPRTLPMFVTMLVRTGESDRAAATIRAALAAEAQTPADTLLRLAGVSAALKLGLESQIFDAVARTGKTPDLALARALHLLGQNRGEEALKQLKDDAAQASTDPAGWQLALTQLQDLTEKEAAPASWKTLVEKHPADLRVQAAYLKSPSRSADRAVWAATIERFKSLTRDEGVNWRVERAAYLLSGKPNDRERADAVNLINELVRTNPDLAEPRLMLATVHLKANNRAAAIEQLKRVAELRPADAQVTLELSKLLQETGNTAESQQHLRRLLIDAQLSPADARLVARMYADQGQLQSAIQALRTAPQGDLPRDVMLAQLYHRDGQTKEAGELFARIAAAKPITADAIAAASDFFMESKQNDRANTVLARFDELAGQVPASVPFVVRGQLAERHEGAVAAQVHYLAAVKQSNDAAANFELAGFYVRHNQLDKARTAAMAGLGAAPGNPDLTALLKAIGDAGRLPETQRVGLLQIMSRQPTDAALNDLLQSSIQAGAESLEQRIDRQQRLVDRHPRFWPAREQLIRAYIDAGQFSKAKDAASVAMGTFTMEAEPARLLYYVHAQSEQWPAARIAAQAWRMRAPGDTRAADVADAEACLNMGRNGEAAACLAPYIESAKTNIDGSIDVLWSYCRALLREGKSGEAAALLGEAAQSSESARRLWLMLAADVRPSAAAASAWINQVAGRVVSDSSREQSNLARAWFLVGQQYHDTASFAKSTALFRQLIARGDNDLGNLVLIGDGLRGMNDYEGAESAYRQAIAAGDGVYSANALAFLLLIQDKSIDQALELSNRAVSASPRNAGYLDTRGQILLKAGKPREAVDDFDRALSIHPNHIESLIGKAQGLSQVGKLDRARHVLQQVDALSSRHPRLAAYSRQQLDALRQSLAK